MILKNRNRKSLIQIIVLVAVLFSAGKLIAQQEMPDNIKDQVQNGIAALDAAKVPQDIETAFSLFSQAADLAPNYPEVHYFLGKTLALMQGSSGKAVKEFKRYLQLYPDAPDKEKVTAEIDELENSIQLNKNSYLLGISLVQLSDGIYVQKVSPNYPSYGRRGVPIRVGDKIVQINDVDLTGYSLLSVMKVFEEDSTETDKPRKITIIRGGESEVIAMYKNNKKPMSVINDLGEDDLNTIIAETKKPLVVFFISDFCDACQSYLRDNSISRPSYKYSKEIAFVSANIDERNSLAKEFNITSTPTICLYKDGQIFDKIVGYDIDLFEEKAEALLK